MIQKKKKNQVPLAYKQNAEKGKASIEVHSLFPVKLSDQIPARSTPVNCSEKKTKVVSLRERERERGTGTGTKEVRALSCGLIEGKEKG